MRLISSIIILALGLAGYTLAPAQSSPPPPNPEALESLTKAEAQARAKNETLNKEREAVLKEITQLKTSLQKSARQTRNFERDTLSLQTRLEDITARQNILKTERQAPFLTTASSLTATTSPITAAMSLHPVLSTSSTIGADATQTIARCGFRATLQRHGLGVPPSTSQAKQGPLTIRVPINFCLLCRLSRERSTHAGCPRMACCTAHTRMSHI